MKWKQDPKNRQKDRDANKKYYHNNPSVKIKRSSQRASRRVKIASHKRDLSKEELDKIYKIYERSRMLTEMTGIQHHVDHIVPISKGGLHHPDNLQILTAEENLKKGAKLISGQDETPIVKQLSDNLE
jgi:5-methylcytosine-specific restriction endonuclease McrA